MTVESSSALILLDQSDSEEGAPRPEKRHQEPVDRARFFLRSQRALGSFETFIIENVHHRPPPHVPRQRSSLPQIDRIRPERCQAHHEVQGFRSQGRDCDRCLSLRVFHQPSCPLAHLVPEPVGEREQRFTVSLRNLARSTQDSPWRDSQSGSLGPRHGPTLSEWSRNTTESGVAAGAPSSTSPLASISSGLESTGSTRRSLFERTGPTQP